MHGEREEAISQRTGFHQLPQFRSPNSHPLHVNRRFGDRLDRNSELDQSAQGAIMPVVRIAPEISHAMRDATARYG